MESQQDGTDMNTKNPRDMYGDGHGFRDVLISKPPHQEYRYNYDLSQAPKDETRILGLYKLIAPGTSQGWVYSTRIIWLAREPTAGLRYVTDERSEHPYYIQDPLAWSETPKP
jgi:hypothetical protein